MNLKDLSLEEVKQESYIELSALDVLSDAVDMKMSFEELVAINSTIIESEKALAMMSTSLETEDLVGFKLGLDTIGYTVEEAGSDKKGFLDRMLTLVGNLKRRFVTVVKNFGNRVTSVVASLKQSSTAVADLYITYDKHGVKIENRDIALKPEVFKSKIANKFLIAGDEMTFGSVITLLYGAFSQDVTGKIKAVEEAINSDLKSGVFKEEAFITKACKRVLEDDKDYLYSLNHIGNTLRYVNKDYKIINLKLPDVKITENKFAIAAKDAVKVFENIGIIANDMTGYVKDINKLHTNIIKIINAKAKDGKDIKELEAFARNSIIALIESVINAGIGASVVSNTMAVAYKLESE